MASGPHGADDHDAGRAVFDCLSAVVLLLTALLGAYLPKYLASRGGQQSGTATSLAFHLGNMLSGGVMLSAGFCHLLADSLRQLAFIGRFPIATFLAAVGYLITLLADQLAQVLTADKPSADDNPDSSSQRHTYMQLEKDENANGVEMMQTQHKVYSNTVSGGADGLVRHVEPSSDEISVWGSITGGNCEGVLPHTVIPAVQFAAERAGDTTSYNDKHVIDSRAADDIALDVAATRAPRALTADKVSSRLGSQLVEPPYRGAGNRACCTGHGGACCSGTAMNGVGNGWEHLQQQQQHAAAVSFSLHSGGASQQPDPYAGGVQQPQRHDGSSDVALLSPKLPCSQHLVTSPTYQQQHQQQQLGHQRGCQHHIDGSNNSRWYPAASSGIDTPVAHHLGHRGQERDNADSTVSASKQQLHVCCSAPGVGVANSTHPEDMTEACTVAKAVGHLELELQSPGTGQAGNHGHAHFQVFLSHQPLSFATTVLLACALCIHSILEGIALGAQQSMQSTQDIMLAIAAHKGLAAYALGASIVESKASNSKFWAVTCMFAIATPLGIGIGYAFSNIGHGSVSAAMSALASGTFLYVALNEVIPKELEHPDGHRLLKVAALLIGFGLMSLLAVWA